jgi:glucose/mannose transport system substrate-binding protein
MHGKNVLAIDGLLAESLTRRQMMTRATALGLSVPIIGMLGQARGSAAQATPTGPQPDSSASGELEIFSWWTAPGEAEALDELFKAYGALYPNVELVNAAIAGGAGGAAQPVLQTRLQGGNPPDSWQTHIGRELYDRYVTPGYCEPISELYATEGWNAVIPQGLIDQITLDGQQYAIPVGVHRGNTFWYNKEVLASAGVTVGDTMTTDEFFAAAETLKSKGITPLAFGSHDGFVPVHSFEDTLLATVGPEKYNQLWAGTIPWDDQGVKDALTTFGQMLEYVNENHPALTWDGATDLVIEGKAAFNTMGDWAYGTVVARGATDKIGYVSHPGSGGSFVLVVDCFTMPKGAPHTQNATNWLRVLGTTAAQEAFNPVKGSIPARTDVDKTKFSAYHQWSIDSFAKDALVPSCAHGEAASPAFQQVVYDAAASFLVDRDVDSFVSMLTDAAES